MPMTPDELEVLAQARINIGALQVQVRAQADQIDELKGMIVALTGKVDELSTTLTEARGGWRMLMLLGGASATLGGALVWALQHLKAGP